jgi:general nucleoside transport system ATP-binding protein
VEGSGSPTRRAAPLLVDVSLRIRRGEVVGIAGVEGNGQQELIEAVLGLRTGDHRDDPPRRQTSPPEHPDAARAGIGYIPEDRQLRGLLLPFPAVGERHARPPGPATLRPGHLARPDGARERTEEIIERFDVRTPGVDVPAHALSGGNQQKLIVGPRADRDPRCSSPPTRPAASTWVPRRRCGRRCAGPGDGLAVLLVSADLEELIGLSDTLR